jgi:hypothetical protein
VEIEMTVRVLVIAIGLAILAIPAANAQAVVRGAREGAAVGNRAAGPVGAAVGSVMGASAFAFRSGASWVLGIPEEAGNIQPQRTRQKKRSVQR